VVVLRSHADPKAVRDALTRLGLWVHKLEGGGATAFSIEPPSPFIEPAVLEALPGVACVLAGASAAPRARAVKGPVRAGGKIIGDGALTLAAGPCAVDGEASLEVIAKAAVDAGATFLRGGAFKPRTSPYAFQGLGREGFSMLSRVGKRHGLAVVSEVLDPRDVEAAAEYCALLQVGSRSMQNTSLLKELARAGRPVLLKRGMSATIAEWLQAAEYLLAGAPVVLCERGVRGFDPAVRNLLDLAAVAVVKRESGLPVLVDPSHAVGRSDVLIDVARAAIAVGADGLLVECHVDRGAAASDGPQALELDGLAALGRMLESLAPAMGRTFSTRVTNAA
jgi:3-deoxy-7-phosphoheptulonate synthase